ncbi:MAG: type 1 glutamine amidotransferase [Phycisphaerales bacterium]|jgi:type 1 glutamine amidotransferase
MFTTRAIWGVATAALVFSTMAGAQPAQPAQSAGAAAPEPTTPWLEYEPMEHEHNSMSVVLISGDEEYRSEEALPQLGKILSQRHGFACTVLFAIDPETGGIDPDNRTNIPGLESLADADLMIIATRFRDLPDEQMAMIDAYVQSGKPIIGMRTATHAFNLSEDSAYREVYTWNSGAEGHEGGFGKQILGETWVAHHGAHGSQSTHGIIAYEAEGHPIARGLRFVIEKEGDLDSLAPMIWGPTDVYRVNLPLPSDATPIVMGYVANGMTPGALPDLGEKNDPVMPVAWTRVMKNSGNINGRRVFTTTMGAATDLVADGTRVMLVNAAYWAMGLEGEIPAGGCEADLVGDFAPSDFGFGGFVKGTFPADHELESKHDEDDEDDEDGEHDDDEHDG